MWKIFSEQGRSKIVILSRCVGETESYGNEQVKSHRQSRGALYTEGSKLIWSNLFIKHDNGSINNVCYSKRNINSVNSQASVLRCMSFGALCEETSGIIWKHGKFRFNQNIFFIIYHRVL